MRLLIRLILACCASTVAGSGSAQQALPLPQVRELASDARGEALASVPDLPGTGPYPALKEIMEGLPNHVAYRPADLSAMGDRKLGVVVWGNGGCRNDAASARFHLLELASHGYLVIAPGGIYSGPGAQPATEQPVEGIDGMPPRHDQHAADPERPGLGAG